MTGGFFLNSRKVVFQMKKLLMVLGGSAAGLLPLSSFAVAPAWVADAMTAAQTTLTDYLAAAAPVGATITIAVAAFYFVVKLILRLAH